MNIAPRKNQLTFTANPDIENRLRMEAERLDRSLAWVINYYLQKGLEAMEVMPKACR